MYERNEIGRNANSALLLTDKDIIESRTRKPAKRAHCDIKRVCIWIGQARHDPVAIDASRRNLVLHDDFNRCVECRYRRVYWRHILAARNLAEPFFNQRLGLRRINIARQHQHRIVRAIMVGEPVFHVIKRGSGQIFQAADGVVMIGMPNGEKRFRTLVIDKAVRLVITLTLFIRNHTDLVVELLLGHGIEQKAHSVAFEEQGRFKRSRRHRLEIIGAVKPGCAVEIRGANLFCPFEIVALGVLAAVEHDMLEQMGVAGLALWLMLRTDAVPDRHCDDWRLAVLMHQHGQAVVERELLMWNVDGFDQFRHRRGLLCNGRNGDSKRRAGQHQREGKFTDHFLAPKAKYCRGR